MARHFITTNKEQGKFPFSFDTINEQILEATEWAKKRQRYPFTHYALNVNLSGCLSIGLFDQEELLKGWLINCMEQGIGGYSRLMRVGKVEELIGERVSDWNHIPTSFVWAVTHGGPGMTLGSTVTGDVNLCWLNVSNESHSEVILKVQGCNRKTRSAVGKEIDLLRSSLKIKRYVEHRWFGMVYQETYGMIGWYPLPSTYNLPPMTHNFHEVVSGNYSMLYIPHLMGK